MSFASDTAIQSASELALYPSFAQLMLLAGGVSYVSSGVGGQGLVANFAGECGWKFPNVRKFFEVVEYGGLAVTAPEYQGLLRAAMEDLADFPRTKAYFSASLALT